MTATHRSAVALLFAVFVFALPQTASAQSAASRVEGPWLTTSSVEPAVLQLEVRPVVKAKVPQGIRRYVFSLDGAHALWLEDRPGLKVAVVVDGKDVGEYEKAEQFYANDDFTRLRFAARVGGKDTHVLVGPAGATVLPPPTAGRAYDFPRPQSPTGGLQNADSSFQVFPCERPDRYFIQAPDHPATLDGKPLTTPGNGQWENSGRHYVQETRSNDGKSQEVFVNGALAVRAPFVGDVKIAPDGKVSILSQDGLHVVFNNKLVVLPAELEKAQNAACVLTPDFRHVIQRAYLAQNIPARLYVDGRLVASGYDDYSALALSDDGRHVAVGVQRDNRYALLVDGKVSPPLPTQVRSLAFAPGGSGALAMQLADGQLIVNGQVLSQRAPAAQSIDFTPDGKHLFWADSDFPGGSFNGFVLDGKPYPKVRGRLVSGPTFVKDGTMHAVARVMNARGNAEEPSHVTGRIVSQKEAETTTTGGEPRKEAAPAPKFGHAQLKIETNPLAPDASGKTVARKWAAGGVATMTPLANLAPIDADNRLEAVTPDASRSVVIKRDFSGSVVVFSGKASPAVDEVERVYVAPDVRHGVARVVAGGAKRLLLFGVDGFTLLPKEEQPWRGGVIDGTPDFTHVVLYKESGQDEQGTQVVSFRIWPDTKWYGPVPQVQRVIVSRDGKHFVACASYRDEEKNESTPATYVDGVDKAHFYDARLFHAAVFGEDDLLVRVCDDGVYANREKMSPWRPVDGNDALLLSPDGRNVAYVAHADGDDGSRGMAVVLNGKAGPVHASIKNLAFTPDSRTVVYQAVALNRREAVVIGGHAREIQAREHVVVATGPTAHDVAVMTLEKLQIAGDERLLSPAPSIDLQQATLTLGPDDLHAVALARMSPPVVDGISVKMPGSLQAVSPVAFTAPDSFQYVAARFADDAYGKRGYYRVVVKIGDSATTPATPVNDGVTVTKRPTRDGDDGGKPTLASAKTEASTKTVNAFARWSKFKAGASVTFRQYDAAAPEGSPSMKVVQKLKEIDDDVVTVEETMLLAFGGQEQPMVSLPKTFGKDGEDSKDRTELVGEGDEEIKVGDRSVTAHWVERKTTGGREKRIKTWYCPEVPGGIVKTEESSTSGTRKKREVKTAIAFEAK
jgi:hypothetical protein